MTYRTIGHNYYPLFGVECDGENPIRGVVFDTEHAANWVRDSLNENAALKGRIAELEAREVDAIANKICGRIPSGYYIKLHLEKEAGWVELACPEMGDGREDFDGGVYSQLVCALEVAENLSKEPANGE